MEKFKKFLPTIIFNIVETITVVLMGMLLKLPVNYIILVLFTFIITRFTIAKFTHSKALHFKTWYRCLIWSLLIMLSLFVLLHVDLTISITFAVFAAFVMTNKSNINDMYLWKSADEPGKYQDVVDFIKYNSLDTKLLEFEDKIKTKSNEEYLLYKYRFKEGRTFDEIRDILDMPNPRIVEHLDKISFALRLYCGI